jgi:hypothetical protein
MPSGELGRLRRNRQRYTLADLQHDLRVHQPHTVIMVGPSAAIEVTPDYLMALLRERQSIRRNPNTTLPCMLSIPRAGFAVIRNGTRRRDQRPVR